MIEKRPARKKGDLSISKQLDLLNAAEAIRLQRAGPDNGSLSYMANVLVRLTMPHRPFKGPDGKPANTFTREYRGLSITISANPHVGLPTGTVPRLLMSFITTEAVRNKNPTVELGRSLNGFLKKLGYASTSGGARGTGTIVKDQLKRLFAANIQILQDRDEAFAVANMNVAKRAIMWWDNKNPDQLGLFNSRVELSTDFFNEIVDRPVPLDMRVLQALSHSPMCLDIYCWLTWRFSHLNRPEEVDWRELQVQFGASYPMTSAGLRDFRNAFRAHLKTVLTVYEDAKVDASESRYLMLRPSPTSVPRQDRVSTALEKIEMNKKSVR